MGIKRKILISTVFVFLVHFIFGQGLQLEAINKEVNKQIFDEEEGYPPGTWVRPNKYHKFISGNIKSESIVYPSGERVFNQFNLNGSLVNSEVYWDNTLYSFFTYEYAEDGITLLKERGTYNIDYFHIDSNNYIGINAFDNGIDFAHQLDTMFVSESKYNFDLTIKRNYKNYPILKYAYRYNIKGSLRALIIYENDIDVGHLLNKYNELNQVTERQNFVDYSYFANEDQFSDLRNCVYKISYDTFGLIQSFTTEIYNPFSRKWETQVQDFKCSLQQEGNHYYAKCMSNQVDYIKVEIDQHGNYIRKEEFANGELKVTSRELIYFD